MRGGALLAVAGTSALALSGCGGAPRSIQPSIPLSQFPARLAQAECRRVLRCCTLPQIQALYGDSVTDESSCEHMLGPVTEDLAAQEIAPGEASHRLRYDGATFAGCVVNADSAPCTAMSDQLQDIPECATFVQPLVSAGGACDSDQECDTGFCSRPVGATGDGACAQIPAKGMSCVSRCATGSRCDTATATCVDANPDGASCVDGPDCLSGFCNFVNATSVRSCQPPLPVKACGPAS